jgi:hypothetical protein
MLILKLYRVRLILAFMTMFILLASCGGGTSVAGVGSGGTGSGVVTGFGSLIVDGIRRNDTGAIYTSEADQEGAATMSMTSAMLGQSAEFSYDNGGNITSVMMSPEIVGPVTAVNSTSITVLGFTITANTDATLGPVTNFVGYASLADIQATDWVEIHGLSKIDYLGNPYLQATLIVLKPAATGVRLGGIVKSYDPTAGSFMLGNETVTVASATTIRPTGMALADGQLVTVWSNSVPTTNTISASTIRIKRPALASGNVTLSGPISNFISNADFQLRNVKIDASTATMTPSSATLANGEYIVVAGSFDATTNKLTASSVTVFTSSAPTAVEVHGMVANFVSTSSFSVRGVVIDASGATVTGTGALTQLANGVFVEIHGPVVNNVVQATTVTFIALKPNLAPIGSIIEIGGIVDTYDSLTGVFTLKLLDNTTVNGSLATSTIYRNGTVSDFAVGQSASIIGPFNNNSLAAVEVVFHTGLPGAQGNMQMTGMVSNVMPNSFMLNGITIQYGNNVPIRGGGMMGPGGMKGSGGMRGGYQVNVSVSVSPNGQYTANAINFL